MHLAVLYFSFTPYRPQELGALHAFSPPAAALFRAALQLSGPAAHARPGERTSEYGDTHASSRELGHMSSSTGRAARCLLRPNTHRIVGVYADLDAGHLHEAARGAGARVEVAACSEKREPGGREKIGEQRASVFGGMTPRAEKKRCGIKTRADI